MFRGRQRSRVGGRAGDVLSTESECPWGQALRRAPFQEPIIGSIYVGEVVLRKAATRRARVFPVLVVMISLVGLALANTAPARMPEVSVQVDAGGVFTCAVKSDAALACWGSSNTYGQATPPAGSYSAVGAGGLSFVRAQKRRRHRRLLGRNAEGQSTRSSRELHQDRRWRLTTRALSARPARSLAGETARTAG